MKKKITVIYKSGTKVHMKAEEFTVTKYANGTKQVEWLEAKPKPLMFGIDDVAAIFEGKV